MKRAVFLFAFTVAFAFFAPGYQSTYAATPAPTGGAVTPLDPHVNCGNWHYSFQNTIWDQCDAGYGPEYIQSQITTEQYDTYWKNHYNIGIYTSGGASQLRNYHLVYDGTVVYWGTAFFTWTINDPNNWIRHTVAEPMELSNASNRAAADIAQFISNDMGYSPLSTEMLNSGGNVGYPAGRGGSLLTACKDLLGRPPGNSH